MSLDPACSASLQAQEFELHGVEMRGPCRTLEKAGCSGKYTSNIQRDILRDVEKRNPIQAISVKKCLYVECHGCMFLKCLWRLENYP